MRGRTARCRIYTNSGQMLRQDPGAVASPESALSDAAPSQKRDLTGCTLLQPVKSRFAPCGLNASVLHGDKACLLLALNQFGDFLTQNPRRRGSGGFVHLLVEVGFQRVQPAFQSVQTR